MLQSYRDPAQTTPLTIWHWLSLVLALVLGAFCGNFIFGIR